MQSGLERISRLLRVEVLLSAHSPTKEHEGGLFPRYLERPDVPCLTTSLIALLVIEHFERFFPDLLREDRLTNIHEATPSTESSLVKVSRSLLEKRRQKLVEALDLTSGQYPIAQQILALLEGGQADLVQEPPHFLRRFIAPRSYLAPQTSSSLELQTSSSFPLDLLSFDLIALTLHLVLAPKNTLESKLAPQRELLRKRVMLFSQQALDRCYGVSLAPLMAQAIPTPAPPYHLLARKGLPKSALEESRFEGLAPWRAPSVGETWLHFYESYEEELQEQELPFAISCAPRSVASLDWKEVERALFFALLSPEGFFPQIRRSRSAYNSSSSDCKSDCASEKRCSQAFLYKGADLSLEDRARLFDLRSDRMHFTLFTRSFCFSTLPFARLELSKLHEAEGVEPLTSSLFCASALKITMKCARSELLANLHKGENLQDLTLCQWVFPHSCLRDLLQDPTRPSAGPASFPRNIFPLEGSFSFLMPQDRAFFDCNDCAMENSNEATSLEIQTKCEGLFEGLILHWSLKPYPIGLKRREPKGAELRKRAELQTSGEATLPLHHTLELGLSCQRAIALSLRCSWSGAAAKLCEMEQESSLQEEASAGDVENPTHDPSDKELQLDFSLVFLSSGRTRSPPHPDLLDEGGTSCAL